MYIYIVKYLIYCNFVTAFIFLPRSPKHWNRKFKYIVAVSHSSDLSNTCLISQIIVSQLTVCHSLSNETVITDNTRQPLLCAGTRMNTLVNSAFSLQYHWLAVWNEMAYTHIYTGFVETCFSAMRIQQHIESLNNLLFNTFVRNILVFLLGQVYWIKTDRKISDLVENPCIL